MSEQIARLNALVPQMAGRRVMVVGDVLLDEYLIGETQRLSREAPIPVIELSERRYIPGGAANPATNIVALGGQAHLVGVVGQDESAQRLDVELRQRGIAPLVVSCTDRPTTRKTRILARMGLRFPQQLARIDEMSRKPVSADVEARLGDYIAAALPEVDALLFSDYHGGLLTPSLVARVQVSALAHDLLVTADAQGFLQKYRGCDLVKCNADDAAAYLSRPLITDNDFAMAARQLYDQLALRRAMVITRGADGATIATREVTSHCPAPQVSDVYDTVGAGDTAIAVLTLACLTDSSTQDAVMLANIASGIVVRHVGNYAPKSSELLDALADLADGEES